MASSNAAAWLKSGTDEYALAITKGYIGLLEQYYINTFFHNNEDGSFYEERDVTGHGSSTFETFADTSEAEDYSSGQERLGQDYAITQSTVTVDRPVTAHQDIRRDQQNVAMNELMPKILPTLGRKLAEKFDFRVYANIVIAARTAGVTKNGLTVHNGGNVVTVSGGTISAAYPRTVAGARKLRDNINQMARQMDEDNVPEMGRLCVISPYLKEVLQQDTTIMDRDLSSSTSDLATRTLGMIGGFKIRVYNGMAEVNTADPSAGSRYFQEKTKYHVDLRSTSAGGTVGTPAAVFCADGGTGMAPLGRVTVGSAEFEIGWDGRRHVNYMSALMQCGYGVVKPWCAGELRVIA